MADFPQPGETVGRYTIGERLGQGGNGTVFRATRSMPRREVALKVIPSELASQPGFREQFLHEADVLSELNSDHIIGIHDVGEDDGFLFIATDLISGGDLGTRLGRGPVPLKPALTITAQINLALSAAHQAGIIHGDVKPTNVLLGQRDGLPHAYLSDFGIAQPTGAGSTHRSVTVGSYAYLAPELISGGAAGPASDIYALGCLLVAAITGAPPYNGTDEEIAQQHLSSEIPHWEETSPLLGQLNQLIKISMAKSPGDRYPTADAFRAAILAVLGEVPEVAPAPVSEAVPAVPAAPVQLDKPAEPEPTAEPAVEPAVEETPAPAPWGAADEQAPLRLPPATEPVFAPDPALLTPDEPDWGEGDQPNRNGRVLVSSLVALLLVVAAVGGIVLLQKDGDGDSASQPVATTSPSSSPVSGQKKVCQEGREVDATSPCGEPYGIEGLRYVFSNIPDGCAEKRLNTKTKYWEITCKQDGANPVTVSYSTFKTTAITREVNDAKFKDSSPVTLPSGLLQFGPERAPSGTWQVGLAYPEKHPYGVLISAGSAESAQQFADDTADGALPPDRFVVE